MCPREVFAKIARDFQINALYFILNLNGYLEGFAIKTKLKFSFFRLGLFYNEVLLDTVV